MRTTGVIAVLLLLAGCGESDQADVRTMEREIASAYTEQSGVDATVACPDAVQWETGGDFRCELDAGDYGSTLITVYMQTDAGEWAWEVG